MKFCAADAQIFFVLHVCQLVWYVGTSILVKSCADLPLHPPAAAAAAAGHEAEVSKHGPAAHGWFLLQSPPPARLPACLVALISQILILSSDYCSLSPRSLSPPLPSPSLSPLSRSLSLISPFSPSSFPISPPFPTYLITSSPWDSPSPLL
jgi:hypothetical protein